MSFGAFLWIDHKLLVFIGTHLLHTPGSSGTIDNTLSQYVQYNKAVISGPAATVNNPRVLITCTFYNILLLGFSKAPVHKYVLCTFY